jgi:hypothetical protein
VPPCNYCSPGSVQPLYIFENTSIQTHRDRTIAVGDFNFICSVIGKPVLLDVVRFGSGAHRLRNFWTNLANPYQVQTVADTITRNPKLIAMMYLDPDRTPVPVKLPDRDPYYQCNKVGEPRVVFPTLVSFRPPQRFVIWVLE